jgi:hypothetical protein
MHQWGSTEVDTVSSGKKNQHIIVIVYELVNISSLQDPTFIMIGWEDNKIIKINSAYCCNLAMHV